MVAMAIRVRIEGRVQGVGYRYWTIREATARGLDGWVRNRRDGGVEALFCGDAEAVRAMIAACREGPPGAHVTAIREFPAAPPEGRGFRSLPTAS